MCLSVHHPCPAGRLEESGTKKEQKKTKTLWFGHAITQGVNRCFDHLGCELLIILTTAPAGMLFKNHMEKKKITPGGNAYCSSLKFYLRAL